MVDLSTIVLCVLTKQFIKSKIAHFEAWLVVNFSMRLDTFSKKNIHIYINCLLTIE